MKAFLCSFPYCWAGMQYWDVEKRLLLFNFVTPFIEEYNTIGKKVIRVKEFGHVQEKELPQPTVAHMLYEFSPLINEHNKA
jgi:hypothetical protein